MDPLRIQTAQNVDLAFAPAGPGERILATLIDGTIVVVYLLGWVFARTLLAMNGVYIGGAGWVVLLLPALFYHFLFEAFGDGRSPGKRLRGLRVARLDGAPPTVGQYALRWLLRWIDVTFSNGVVALTAVALTKHGQRLGDLAAGTTVLKLARPVDLVDVEYPRIAPGYTPRFPDAERLSDADVRTIRAVLLRLRRAPASDAASDLGRRAKAAVEDRLGLAPVGLTPEAFLQAVVTDYTAAHDRYAG